MKAIIKIECIGDDSYQKIELYKQIITEILNRDIASQVIGNFKRRYFVAEIIGFHTKFIYDRKFLTYKKDYKNGNSKGSRGIYAYFILESGKIYDVLKPISWKNSKRYFCTVNKNGDIIKLTKEEVDKCLKSRSELMY